MSKHTPGPWEVERSLNGDYSVRHTATGNHPICDVFYVTETGQANASLIAAAPDLLAACKALLEMPMLTDKTYDQVQAVRKLATAAIAKATGEAK